MATLETAALQLDIAWEDPDENFRRAGELAARAAGAGARLLVLPEMFATGFSMDAARMAPHGTRARDFLAATAERHGVYVLGGYAEPGQAAGARPRNACSLHSPTGTELLRYHKIHPFGLAGEDQVYEGGHLLPSAEVEGVRLTALICYDLRFPEPFRVTALATDLFVVVANWPDARIEHWSALLTARAIENQAFVLGVNRAGEGDGLSYCGRSALVDPLGREVARLAGQAGLVTGRVDSGAVAEVRTRLPFLGDRRPEVYRRLAG